jgi:predicted DNA-binding protein YlxM (UPF0122 family)
VRVREKEDTMAITKAKKVPAEKPAVKKSAPAKKASAEKSVAKKTAPAKKDPAKKPEAGKVPATTAPVTMKKTAEEVSKMSVYFDFYGGLLSDQQQDAYKLYNDENLSLSEIAETLGISRQGVHERLKKSDASLNDFETKLGLIKKNDEQIATIRSVEDIVAKIIEDEAITSLDDKKARDRLRRQLKKVVSTVKTMENDD